MPPGGTSSAPLTAGGCRYRSPTGPGSLALAEGVAALPVEGVEVLGLDEVDAGLADVAQTAIADGDVLGVVLMSARSAELFRAQLRDAGIQGASGGIAVIAGSPAIAEAAGAGWRQVYVARRPTRARLLAIAALLYARRDRAV